jgi:rRNA maturation endonuclease Nob1
MSFDIWYTMRENTCPACGSPMKRLYERYQNPDTGKREWIGVAWRCINPNCDQIVRGG